MTQKIEAPPNVYQRLNAARDKFHSLELKKSGRNTFANYSYFELGDFLVPAMRICSEVGLTGVTTFHDDAAYLEVINVDEPGDKIVFRSPMGSAALKGCHEVQNVGAVETYQRRYLWTMALEIVEHDALDATTGDKAPDEKPKRQPAHSKLKTELRGFAREIEGIGDWDQWVAFRELAETKRLISEMQDKLPDWWDGMPDNAPPEFVPYRRRIEILEASLAEQQAEYARA